MHKREYNTIKNFNKKHNMNLNLNTEYSKCPYCGNEMGMRLRDRTGGYYVNPYSLSARNADTHVCYECPFCKAQSPKIRISTSLISEDILKSAIQDEIVRNLECDLYEKEDEQDE